VAAPEKNQWFDDRCAEAFWDQQHAVPYQELLTDTLTMARPASGERWLDLGCGGGPLTVGLWRATRGGVDGIVAVDCAAANERAIAKVRTRLSPPASEQQIEFRVGDLSQGLQGLPDGAFDGVISGLAVSYAESRDPATGAYTDAAYRRIFAEVGRVLKPGGRLVFSVNVPEPKFWRVFWKSFGRGLRVAHARRVFFNALKMQRVGGWLKREARKGRFHFLPIEQLVALVESSGLRVVEHQRSYADQAFVMRAEKSAASGVAAA